MLKSIDPMLNADVLYALRAMGHGDDLILADTNFPSDSVARQTVLGKLLRLDCDAGRAAKAILSVLPLDSFVEYPALRMEVVGKPKEVPPVQADVQKEIDAAEGKSMADGLDRALRLLRPRAEGLLRHPDRRAPILRLLCFQEGRDPARRGLAARQIFVWSGRTTVTAAPTLSSIAVAAA